MNGGGGLKLQAPNPCFDTGRIEFYGRPARIDRPRLDPDHHLSTSPHCCLSAALNQRPSLEPATRQHVTPAPRCLPLSIGAKPMCDKEPGWTLLYSSNDPRSTLPPPGPDACPSVSPLRVHRRMGEAAPADISSPVQSPWLTREN